MRKQYFFRQSPRGLLAWDVDRLVAVSRDFPVRRIPLDRIREVDEAMLENGEPPSWRAIVEHVRLMEEADLAYPIILAANGEVMDGMHRVAKALLRGQETIEAVQFEQDPEPDYVGRDPDSLPY